MSAADAVAAINAEIHDDGTRAVYYNTHSQPTHFPPVLQPAYYAQSAHAHPSFESFAAGNAYDDLMAAAPAYPMVTPSVGAAAAAATAAATPTPTAAAAGSTAAASVPERQSRKRAKPPSSNEEEGERKRPRGRPRVSPQDESAAERRRTQIRIAQRAFRDRKDNTIQTLEKRVDDLRSTNDEMTAAFKKLRDLAATAGIITKDAGFAEVLQSASLRFLNLAEQQEDRELDALAANIPPQSSSQAKPKDKGKGRAPPDSFAASFAADELAADRLSERPPQRPIYPAGHHPPHRSMALLNGPGSFRPQRPVASGPPFPYSETVYEVIAEPTPDNASFPSSLPIHDPGHPPMGRGATTTTREPEPETGPQTGPQPQPEPHYIPVPHRWGYDIWKKLPTPIGYAHHERTFGRRLHRAGVELGMSLVCNPNPPPHIYASVFGFCLLFESQEQIRARLGEMLSKPADETFNNWKVPFLKLGGAGGHGLEAGSGASQGGAYGNQGLRDDHRPAHDTGFSMGPFSSLVEEARQSRLDCRMRMLLPGFQGDFFDPEDIELYLRNRGVSIPGNADYVEADIDIGDFTEGEVAPETTPYDGRVPRRTEMYDQAVTGALYMLHGPPLVSTEPISWVTGKPKETVPQFSSHAPKKRRVVVNVEVLINEINFRSVCLGRAPGTRPRDVNVAFWRSVTIKA